MQTAPQEPPPPRLHPDKPSFSCTVKTGDHLDNNSEPATQDSSRSAEGRPELRGRRGAVWGHTLLVGGPVRSLHPFTWGATRGSATPCRATYPQTPSFSSYYPERENLESRPLSGREGGVGSPGHSGGSRVRGVTCGARHPLPNETRRSHQHRLLMTGPFPCALKTPESTRLLVWGLLGVRVG